MSRNDANLTIWKHRAYHVSHRFAAVQRFWVDTADDGDSLDETALPYTTTIDDDWGAGCDSVHCAKPCLRGVPRKHATRRNSDVSKFGHRDAITFRDQLQSGPERLRLHAFLARAQREFAWTDVIVKP